MAKSKGSQQQKKAEKTVNSNPNPTATKKKKKGKQQNVAQKQSERVALDPSFTQACLRTLERIHQDQQEVYSATALALQELAAGEEKRFGEYKKAVTALLTNNDNKPPVGASAVALLSSYEKMSSERKAHALNTQQNLLAVFTRFGDCSDGFQAEAVKMYRHVMNNSTQPSEGNASVMNNNTQPSGANASVFDNPVPPAPMSESGQVEDVQIVWASAADNATPTKA